MNEQAAQEHAQAALRGALEALEETQGLLEALRSEIRKANADGVPFDDLAVLLRRSAELSLLKARGEELAAALAEALAQRSG